MKAKYLMAPLRERLKSDTTLREIADILLKEKRDERSGIKGGTKPC